MPILRVEMLTKKFGGLTALNEVNFEVGDMEIVGLIGPNGAGKTTCFNIITGIHRCTSGKIFVGDNNITAMTSDAIAREGVARTFQNIRLFNDLTVEQNILLGAFCRSSNGLFSEFISTSKARKELATKQDLVNRILEYLELTKYRLNRASSLPYGLQRRLEVGRALGSEPKVLLLDEPTAGLNPTESREFMELVRNTFS